ncbi:hypothetical protein LSH36_276g02019 [Paralvinella palmiformis]|uniref:Anillin homology domain-containing protein n=1 Tax=Paralvinella palmiformis TaxID=53620 RepID=A0AAD9JK02_9ANNE|nr:hypothetical protein LSH36_276g02019 [Paralvinella palmiformis]
MCMNPEWLFEDGSLTNQITRELHSSKRFMVLRSSSKDLTSASTPTTTAATSSSKLSTRDTFQQRASLIKLKTTDDHNRNAQNQTGRTDHRRYAVLCLVKIGTEIYHTALLKNLDRTCTDLTFDDVIILGPKFDCIGSATLKLSEADHYVGIFNLNLESGNFCCRLVAQPHCLVQDTISGQMYFQDPDSLDWDCTTVVCPGSPYHVGNRKFGSGSTDITIPVTKSTQVSEVPASLCKHEHCIQIIGNGSRYNLAASDMETTKKWWDAIYQHLLDQGGAVPAKWGLPIAL